MPQLSPNAVVGTWTSETPALTTVNLAVLQFRPDHTFIEEADIGGKGAAYAGVWLFDPNSQRIAYQITAALGDVPANPFNTPTLSSTVAVGLGSPLTVRLNNDLLFTMKSTSVNLSDFVMPAPPTPTPRPGTVRAAIAAPDQSYHPVMPLIADH